MSVYADITKTVGKTPLVMLNRITEGMPGNVAVKLESAVIVNVPRPNVNLFGSGISVIESAEIEKFPIFISN